MAKKVLVAVGLTLAVLLVTPFLAMAAPSCDISTTSVSFGTYNVFSATPLDSTGSVSSKCTGNAANITIALDRGGAASFNPRQMLKGTEALNYNLYRDAARTTIWGDGTGGTSVYSDPSPPNGLVVTITIYGRIPAGQDVSAGTYTNTVTVTITF